MGMAIKHFDRKAKEDIAGRGVKAGHFLTFFFVESCRKLQLQYHLKTLYQKKKKKNAPHKTPSVFALDQFDCILNSKIDIWHRKIKEWERYRINHITVTIYIIQSHCPLINHTYGIY